MRLIAFNDEQLKLISEVAQPVPWKQRGAYLDRVIELLTGRQYSNRDVQHAAARAQRELIGIVATTE
jgi:hypothetical protein